MVPRKLTGIVRAQCSVAGTARGEDAEVAAAALCTESFWMTARRVTIRAVAAHLSTLKRRAVPTAMRWSSCLRLCQQSPCMQ